MLYLKKISIRGFNSKRFGDSGPVSAERTRKTAALVWLGRRRRASGAWDKVDLAARGRGAGIIRQPPSRSHPHAQIAGRHSLQHWPASVAASVSEVIRTA